MRVKGLDCSHWNFVDWAYWWDQGYRFAIIKVTEGTGFEDEAWLDHYAGAKEKGFLVGPYHWFTPYLNGISQARWMHSVARVRDWDLGPTLDVEEQSDLSPEVYGARVRAFINECYNLWEKSPIVYTSAYKWKATGNITVPADLWVAHWTSRPEPLLPVGWTEWTFWQTGVDVLDQDVFNGTEEQLREYAEVGNNGEVYEHEVRVPKDANDINLYIRKIL